MHRLLRYYSQNRIKVWTIVLAIIFIILLIQILNNFAKQEKQNTDKGETASNVVSYRNESKTIITGGAVPKIYQERFGNLIDEFYTYCVNHEPEKAYELLAPDTKKILYQTQRQFEKLYYEEKFEGNKDFSFQSWTTSSDDIYIYQVKIFDNMLVTGKTNDEYIEDFVTIVPVEDTYKLNINRYIGRKNRNKKQTDNFMTMEVSISDVYLDYEIYTIRIKNNTEKTILLDTRRKINTTYIQDNNGNKFEAFLYELPSQDLILKPQESKEIQIKFNDVYHNEIEIKSINFTDIVDYEQYQQNEKIETNTFKVDL